ncbi:hypothetical protein ABW20_dc0107902 [Dactylellina cionopaga]|nr:hypothetical protein ABW20_dc0107902 [Dactylellina cionopaga]
MRHGFKQEIALKILETRGMTNWEVLQTDCTALFFKKYWDRMNINIASRMRQRHMATMTEGQSSTGETRNGITATAATREKKCAIL